MRLVLVLDQNGDGRPSPDSVNVIVSSASPSGMPSKTSVLTRALVGGDLPVLHPL